MPRLLQRRNQEPSASTTAPSTTELPDYQELACSLSQTARNELGTLSEKRSTGSYKSQLDKSIDYLTISVTDLFYRLSTQAALVESNKRKREEKGLEPTDEDTKLDRHVKRIEQLALGLGTETEEAIRAAIDGKFELEDESVVISGIYTEAATEGAAIRNAGEDAQAEVRPILSNYRRGIREKKQEYKNLSMRDRYAKNNDYAAFTKAWHDEVTGGEGPPLPDASKWFNSEGELVLSMQGALNRRMQGGDGGIENSDDDDELAIAREVLSFKCPLTLRTMEEPYSNLRCKHTFERAAIWAYLPADEEIRCPQAGCSQLLDKRHWDRDFYLDRPMLRRIERAKRLQESQDNEENEEDEPDESIFETGHRRKRNKSVKRERASMNVDAD